MTAPDHCDDCGRPASEAVGGLYNGWGGTYCAGGCGFHDHPRRRHYATLTPARLDALEDAADRDDSWEVTAAELHELVRLAREVGELYRRVAILAEAGEMACETPPPGCKCPGCTRVREENETLERELGRGR